MTLKPEMLFVDPCVPDIPAILRGLRGEVEVVLLDGLRPAARQMAEALRARSGLEAVHVMTHGAPGRMSFTAGEWSEATLKRDASDMAAIGGSLRDGGELRLWACEVGRGAAGEAFVLALAEAAGTEVAAAIGLVGAAKKGGAWGLAGRGAATDPPLTVAGAAAYGGVLDGKIRVKASGSPIDGTAALASGSYFVAANLDGETKIVGQFSFLQGYGLNMYVGVSDFRDSYVVHAGNSDAIRPGCICIYDPSGKYSQTATRILLGPDGAIIAASAGSPVRIWHGPDSGGGR